MYISGCNSLKMMILKIKYVYNNVISPSLGTYPEFLKKIKKNIGDRLPFSHYPFLQQEICTCLLFYDHDQHAWNDLSRKLQQNMNGCCSSYFKQIRQQKNK